MMKARARTSPGGSPPGGSEVPGVRGISEGISEVVVAATEVVNVGGRCCAEEIEREQVGKLDRGRTYAPKFPGATRRDFTRNRVKGPRISSPTRRNPTKRIFLTVVRSYQKSTSFAST